VHPTHTHTYTHTHTGTQAESAAHRHMHWGGRQRRRTGSNRAMSWPMLAPAATPGPPTRPAPMFDTMLPYRFGMTITSNCDGRATSCTRRHREREREREKQWCKHAITLGQGRMRAPMHDTRRQVGAAGTARIRTTAQGWGPHRVRRSACVYACVAAAAVLWWVRGLHLHGAVVDDDAVVLDGAVQLRRVRTRTQEQTVRHFPVITHT
jgi:hypothetical protein